MSMDREYDKWQEIVISAKALINLIDPDRKQVNIITATFRLIVLEHKQSGSTLHITNIKTAIKDITYFVNNDPAKNFTEEMTKNENMVSNKH